MNLSELLKNKTLLAVLVAGLLIIVLLIVLIIVMASSGGGNKGEKEETPKVPVEKVIKEPLTLFTTDNIGKAIEIQALLARQKIVATRVDNGSKTTLVLKEYTPSERDMALIAIVSSGLMDQFVGLEIFDKGDFTSTKEDKRIRLARAINGELSRLIRKIKPIENASVFVSIPEQTMFSADKKPVTATVQLVIPSGEKLDNNKVKAIKNLLLGSITGLEAENISITDTNGNVYNSIVNSLDDQLSKIQENDMYMQNKIAAQLDRLIGKGNYVVTVSTFLRQVPIEKTSIVYDPQSKTSISEQTFSEGLGDKSEDSAKTLNAVSVYLPNGLPEGSNSSQQDRNYSRVARETQYGVSKTQINEYMRTGVVEDITIAVTIDSTAMPANMTEIELKQLIAGAASPKVDYNNVSIAYSDNIDPYLAADKNINLPELEETGNPWWITVVLALGGIWIGFILVSNKLKEKARQQEAVVSALQEKTLEQERQLRDVNLKAAQLIEKQAQMQQGLMEQQAMAQQLASGQVATVQQEQAPQIPISTDVQNLVSTLAEDVSDANEDEVVEQVKSWIEKF